VLSLNYLAAIHHGTGDFRCLIELDFHAVAFPVMEEEQIQFGCAMRGPEVRFGWADNLKDLFDRIPFP
jgi:hypothetical protein